jgi:predicted branched-subunit amino acid permease
MNWTKGVKDGIPIGIGYFAVSFSFGIAGSHILSWPLVTLISMFNLTSAGQFAGLKIIESLGTIFEMAVATFFINLRYSLMAISLSQKVDSSFGIVKRLLLSTGITDEIYAVAMAQKSRVSASYFFGLMCFPYLGWSLGTFVGAFSGSILPVEVSQALGVALYAMFVAIVVPEMKKQRSVFIVVILSIICSLLFYYAPVLNQTSVGFSIILSAMIASAIGAILFPVEENIRE